MKWHLQKQVGTALIELARQASLSHIKLEQSVTGRQGNAPLRHIFLRAQPLLGQIGLLPSTHNEAARRWLPRNLLHLLADPINGPTIRAFPTTPLRTVYQS